MAEEKKNPFDPEKSAEEFTVAGQKLVLRPLKVKQFRALVAEITRATTAVSESAKSVGQGGGNITNLLDEVFACTLDVLKAVFPPAEFPFLTQEFIDDNFTVEMVQHVIERVIVMNRMESIFPNLASALRGEKSETKTGG